MTAKAILIVDDSATEGTKLTATPIGQLSELAKELGGPVSNFRIG